MGEKVIDQQNAPPRRVMARGKTKLETGGAGMSPWPPVSYGRVATEMRLTDMDVDLF